ncbi:MAG: polysaccharide biosynthesis tyrosine autokinase [Candidatus Omnitrophica bacterium]|nr:polysaccharide biosynthesis tyrosine autokinase [Candidatus Omnitrophota bacterium]
MAEVTSPAAMLHNPSEGSRYELTLGDYWRILIKRKFIIFLTFISVLVGTIAYTNAQIPIYRAAAGVKVSQGGSGRAFMSPDMFMGGGSDAMATYQSTMTSQKVVERVVLRLGLLAPDATKESLAAKADEIRDSISTKQLGDTNIISIIVQYTDAKLCASIANQTAEVFVENDLLDKTRQARNLRQFVEKQLFLFEGKLKTTEEKIQNFRQSGKALGIAIGLERQLSDLERERTLLLKQFTEKHPDVVKADEMIAGVRKNIKNLPSNELELARLQRDLEINDRSYRVMKEKFEQARLSEVETVSEVSVAETASVNKTPISPKKNLNKMIGSVVGIILGIIFAFGVESLDTSIGTIEDVERTIRLPVVGVVPFFDPSAEDLPWWRVDQSIMHIVKRRMSSAPDSSALIMNQDSFSTLSEAYRILRTFVEFILERQPGEGGKVLLITSTGPQEGKSLTSCNLAISLAQAGRKTLLIDADLRRPVVHRLFGLKRSPGLGELLLNMATLDEVKCSMGDILIGENSQWDKVVSTKMLDRLEVMPTGQSTENPAELLASAAMKKLLIDLRQVYDYVILDTPPVLPVTDARTLGILADCTFFIYRAGKTARRSLIRATEELNLAGVKVKGIILNHATAEATLTDRDYYQYYGETKKENQSQKRQQQQAQRKK